MRITPCVGCGWSIEWAVTSKNRKPIPLDVGSNPDGNLIVVGETDDGTKIVRALGKADLQGLFPPQGPFYMPHHASCPFADKFRKKHALRRVD